MQLEPDGQIIKKAQIDDLIHEMSKTAMETDEKSMLYTMRIN